MQDREVATIARAREYRTSQLAAVFGVKPGTIARWIDCGDLPGYRLPGRRGDRRVSHDNLMEYLRTRPEYLRFADRIRDHDDG